MKKRMMAIALIMVPCFVFGATLPEPMLTYPHDTIFVGSLLDTLWCPHDSATVFYTTDGSKPNTLDEFVPPGSRMPFRFDSTVTLKAYSWWRMESGEVLHSDTITLKYTEKLSPPINLQLTYTFIDSIIVDIARPESGAIIHYTTDGSTPDSTSMVYSLSIILKETTTLKYFATKKNCLPSDVLTRVFEKVSVNVKNTTSDLQKDITLTVIPSRISKNNLVFTFTLAQRDKVTISIIDCKGHLITTVANANYEKGIHELLWAIGDTPQGIYLVKINTSKGKIVKGFSLVR
jgi:hypothetical protein